MKCIIFDPCSGASGDMIMGALIDLGADKNKITTTIQSIPSVSISMKKTNKKGINATKITIKPGENSKEKA
ncbi:MAG: DUF111 family protein, partial [Candidatus Diapherotrites archaeon]|nr:DUF111 family protein [Candidatus Diapherotrites archaeon]